MWLRVLWRELGWSAFRGVWYGWKELRAGNTVDKLEWRRRMRICQKCWVYDKEYRACRLGKMGCGCYVPYMALVKDECWIREKYGLAFGWSISDVEKE